MSMDDSIFYYEPYIFQIKYVSFLKSFISRLCVY